MHIYLIVYIYRQSDAKNNTIPDTESNTNIIHQKRTTYNPHYNAFNNKKAIHFPNYLTISIFRCFPMRYSLKISLWEFTLLDDNDNLQFTFMDDLMA